MDLVWLTVTEETTEQLSATPWSMWQLWNVPFVGELWVSNRTRQMVDRVKITRYGQTCRRHCPPGYRPYGDPPTGCEWWNPDDPTHSWADPIHTVSRTARVETQEHRWTKYEWRTRTDNPYWDALQLILSSGGVLLHVGAKKGAGGLTAAPLPALVAGERLILGKANSDFSMFVDGMEHQPGKAIVLEKLGLGSHLIELSGKHPKLGKATVQLPLTVIAPLAVQVPPLTKIVLTEEENGGFVQARITNQSRSDQCVHVRMESTPPGWMAVPLGEPVRVLSAGDEMEVSIQIERMVVLDSSEDPLSFSLRISLPGTSLEDVMSTFYISAKAPRRTKSQRTAR